MSKIKRPGLLRRAWLLRLEPNLNKRGQFAPAMQRQWLSIVLAVAVALLFEWALFGVLADDWNWPWVQVRELNGTSDSLVQPAIALLTPVIALVTAVFAYRKSTISLAESQRADVAAFQQRFIDAAKLLTDVNASTRIAGATSMGSLARDWRENRQECVDVLCGYLRVRPVKTVLTEMNNGKRHTFAWAEGEDVVRRQVVSQLRRILIAGSEARLGMPALNLDLQGAWFPEAVSFATAPFTGDALFSGAKFTGNANFAGADFQGVSEFEGAIFAGDALFDDCTFAHDAWFPSAEFEGIAHFRRTSVFGSSSFDEAKFRDRAWFVNATVVGRTWFTRATLDGRASFEAARFGDVCSFAGTVFAGTSLFTAARFDGLSRFGRTNFLGSSSFSGTTFADNADFEGSTFSAVFPVRDGTVETRGDLGPLSPESCLPEPPGSVVGVVPIASWPCTWTRAAPAD